MCAHYGNSVVRMLTVVTNTSFNMGNTEFSTRESEIILKNEVAFLLNLFVGDLSYTCENAEKTWRIMRKHP